MKRKDFVKLCGILGVSLPFQFAFSSCGENENPISDFKGKVIIIGAGAGGLSAGYLLQQQGIDFEILEASPIYGGRMLIDNNFADFPIPLGAEWLETSTSIFKEIVNNASVEIDIETASDAPDRKFVNSSWLNFFEEYIIPSIADKIVYNSIVESIDYSEGLAVITTNNRQYISDKVIVSVPLKILQDGDIDFIPVLPQEQQNAINEITIWDGFKAFIEFTENFYGNGMEFNISPSSDGQKIYYDAALGQNTSKHILGLFVVGKPTQDYTSLNENDLKDFILNELDGIYSNQASSKYVKHISKNWKNEPFIKAGYMSDEADYRTVRKLSKPINDIVYFAGGAYTDGEDWVSVHTCAQSAKVATDKILY